MLLLFGVLAAVQPWVMSSCLACAGFSPPDAVGATFVAFVPTDPS